MHFGHNARSITIRSNNFARSKLPQVLSIINESTQSSCGGSLAEPFQRRIALYVIIGLSCGCNSVVECHLPKVNVVGSSPIARFLRVHMYIAEIFVSFCTVTNYLSSVTS